MIYYYKGKQYNISIILEMEGPTGWEPLNFG